MSTITRTADLRPNAYPGTCSDCGREVTKMAGYLGPKVAGSWTIHHKACKAAVAPRKQVRTQSYRPARRAACITGGNCSSFGYGRSCGGYDCDGN